jgi:hypothetical protein
MKHKIIVLFLVLSMPILLFNCFRIFQQVERSEVIGAYVLNKSVDFDSLYLYSDSTYCQYYLTDDGSLDSNCNLWRFIPNEESLTGDARIKLSKFRSVTSKKRELIYRRGTCFIKDADELKLVINDDLGIYFIKCSTEQ